mmetsp:Transcript_6737/g.25213  ORF Transcript_6737/g.25213 Transcript_6737/m.25213 type:complete len:239 (+) Transcript_6737:2226-2942(+)
MFWRRHFKNHLQLRIHGNLGQLLGSLGNGSGVQSDLLSASEIQKMGLRSLETEGLHKRLSMHCHTERSVVLNTHCQQLLFNRRLQKLSLILTHVGFCKFDEPGHSNSHATKRHNATNCCHDKIKDGEHPIARSCPRECPEYKLLFASKIFHRKHRVNVHGVVAKERSVNDSVSLDEIWKWCRSHPLTELIRDFWNDVSGLLRIKINAHTSLVEINLLFKRQPLYIFDLWHLWQSFQMN